MFSFWAQKKYLVLIALGIGILGGIVYVIFWNQQLATTYTITVGKDGFIPSSLSIKQGEAVTFVSDGTVAAFWPASDSHPSHGIYPEFDPKEPIPAGESWTFVFLKTGLWKAHDHMNSHANGQIMVYSQEGVMTDNCLAREVDTSIKFQPECWEKEFTNLLKNEGEEKLFETLNAYTKTDTVFKNNCHDVMHIIGKISYENLQSEALKFVTDMTNCGYGFFHGFVETIYSDTGSYLASRDFCDQLAISDQFLSKDLAEGAAAACWHGVGHAIFDSQDGTAWGDATEMAQIALKECEYIFLSLEQRQGCASGVFNALDVAFSANNYGLSFNETDPFSHCSPIPEVYKTFCIFDVAAFYASHQKLNRDEALSLFRTVDDSFFSEIITSWTADNVQWRTTNTEEEFQEAKLCLEFTDKTDIEACLLGVHLGIFKKNGPLENQAESKKVCDLFTDININNRCREFILIRV